MHVLDEVKWNDAAKDSSSSDYTSTPLDSLSILTNIKLLDDWINEHLGPHSLHRHTLPSSPPAAVTLHLIAYSSFTIPSAEHPPPPPPLPFHLDPYLISIDIYNHGVVSD